MQTNNTIEQKVLILNYPKNLDLVSLFPNYRKNIEKVIFLINQINHFSKHDDYGYVINLKNFKWLFSCGNLANDIVKILIDSKIIYISKGYVPNKTGKAYKMVKPFKADSSNEQLFYKLDTDDIPKFIQKWVIDEYKVMNAETTKYKSESKSKVVKQQSELLQPLPTPSHTVNLDVEKRLNEMSKTIEELIEENKRLKQSIVDSQKETAVAMKENILNNEGVSISNIVYAFTDDYDLESEVHNQQYKFKQFLIYKSDSKIKVDIYDNTVQLNQLNKLVANYIN